MVRLGSTSGGFKAEGVCVGRRYYCLVLPLRGVVQRPNLPYRHLAACRMTICLTSGALGYVGTLTRTRTRLRVEPAEGMHTRLGPGRLITITAGFPIQTRLPVAR